MELKHPTVMMDKKITMRDAEEKDIDGITEVHKNSVTRLCCTLNPRCVRSLAGGSKKEHYLSLLQGNENFILMVD